MHSDAGSAPPPAEIPIARALAECNAVQKVSVCAYDFKELRPGLAGHLLVDF
jgi:hypothetical protein